MLSAKRRRKEGFIDRVDVVFDDNVGGMNFDKADVVMEGTCYTRHKQTLIDSMLR